MGKEINNYFKNIDNSHKAYWLGFLWADGYVWKRIRNRGAEYGLKLDLSSVDYDMLVQFKKDLNISTDIKSYAPYKTSFSTTNGVCRCSYYNKTMVSMLMDKYGIIPHRTDVMPLLKQIPIVYEKDFIRGILDADGSFTYYQTMDYGALRDKFSVIFGGTSELMYFIWLHLKTHKVICSVEMPRLYKRHPERDGCYYDLRLCGKKQTKSILHYLYDNAEIYLPRKYQKYKNIQNILDS
jgi:hypothetical protein